ncbi:MAG: hypothetical protein QW728_02105 [Thermoplasmata archaeon]
MGSWAKRMAHLLSVVILFLPLFFSSVLTAGSFLFIPASAEDQQHGSGINNTGELKKVHLYLTGSNGDLLITPPESNATNEAKIPGTFRQTGFFGFGIIPVGQAEWMSWKQFRVPAIKSDIQADDAIEINIWVTASSSGYCDFRFTLYKGMDQFGEPITLSDVHIGTNEYVNVKGEWKLNSTQTFKRGQTFMIQLDVSCAYTGDSPFKMVWGSKQYDTGVTFTCNAIQITGISSDGNTIKAEFQDAFGFPFDKPTYKSNIKGTLNGEPLGSDFVVNAAGSGKVVTWNKKISGRNQVIVAVSYGENVTWTMETFLLVGGEEKSFFTTPVIIGISSAAVILIIVVIAVIVKSSRAKPKTVSYYNVNAEDELEELLKS